VIDVDGPGGRRCLVFSLPESFYLRNRFISSLPSANVFVAWNRSRLFHRFKDLKRRYAVYILAAQVGNRWGPPADRVEVEIVRRCGRFYDQVNLEGACKYLEDALVHARIVVDDSPEHMTRVVRQEKAPKGERGVVVTVTEMLTEVGGQ